MKKLDAEDLRRLIWNSEPALSPDGRKAAFVRGGSVYATGKNCLRVVMMDLDTGEEHELQPEFSVCRCLIWSPDSSQLAFIAAENGVSSLWVAKADAERARRLAGGRHGADHPAWSPDGIKIAYEACWMPGEDENRLFEIPSDDEWQAMEKQRREAPQAFENLVYKLDEVSGMRDGTRTAIAVVTANTGDSRIVSPMDCSYLVPSWLRSGEIVCYGRPYSGWKEIISEIYRLPMNGEAVLLKNTAPVYAPFPIRENADGSLVYCGAKSYDGASMAELFAIPKDGGESCHLFSTFPDCHGLTPILSGDTHLEFEDCGWTMDENGNICFLAYHEGHSAVYRRRNGATEQLTHGREVLAFSGPCHGRLLILACGWNDPAHLELMELHGGETSRLTDDNRWLDEFELTEPRELTLTREDGTRIRGWCLVPDGQEKLPAVLDVHGGPESCYISGFFFEAQVMAARGLAVLFCDPRGSAGYGPEFMQGKYAYGQEVVDDLHAFVMAACERYPIDPKRVGVTGGSYGGHMTFRLAAQTDDYACAVTQRTWVNPSTSYGTGDMGFYSMGDMKESFMSYMENRVRRSLMQDVRGVKIPMLVLHGEKDYRCALEQGEQVYNVLRSLKPELPVRMVIFPGENHGVTRHGLMHNQIRHMKEMADWMEKYLCGEGTEA